MCFLSFFFGYKLVLHGSFLYLGGYHRYTVKNHVFLVLVHNEQKRKIVKYIEHQRFSFLFFQKYFETKN